MDQQFNIPTESEIFAEKNQKELREFLLIISYFCKELLLSGSPFEPRYVSHVAHYKLRVIGTTQRKKKDRKTREDVFVDEPDHYVDPVFRQIKTLKYKDEKPKAILPGRETKLKIISSTYKLVGKNPFVTREFEDAPKKFYSSSKSVLNFFTMIKELYLTEIRKIYTEIDAHNFSLDRITEEGIVSKVLLQISRHKSRVTFVDLKFREYNKEMQSHLDTAETKILSDLRKGGLLDLANMKEENKKLLAEIFVEFIYATMLQVCTFKVVKIEKKITLDIDAFIIPFFQAQISAVGPIPNFPEIIRSADRKILAYLKNSKKKDKNAEPELTVETESLEEFKSFMKNPNEQKPKATVAIITPSVKDEEEDDDDDDDLDDSNDVPPEKKIDDGDEDYEDF